MRLIDADALMRTLGIADECEDCMYQSYNFCGRENDFVVACEAITDAPTIEPERKNGRWIKKEEGCYYWYECSECGTKPLWNEWRTDRCFSAFCPNCGARMEVEG